jgi:hypothetical protein
MRLLEIQRVIFASLITTLIEIFCRFVILLPKCSCFSRPRASVKYRPYGGCVLPAVVDDVYFCTTYQAMDGPRRVLGSARPTEVRAADLLTIAGEMRFDTADLTYL